MGKIFNINRLNEEYLRLKKVKLVSLIALLVGILAAGGGIAIAVLANRGVGVAFILGGLIIVAASVVVTMIAKNKIRKQVTETLVEASVKRVLEGVSYKADGCVSESLIKTADMDFDFEYDRVLGANLFTGTYNGVGVEMSEVNLVTVKTETDGEGGTAEKETGEFKGVWCTLDMGDSFPCELMIRERSGKLSKLAAKVFGSGKSITTDNKEFNTDFIITSDDEESALELLSEQFITYILEFNEAVNGEVYIRFNRNGKLHIAVGTNKTLFKLDRKLSLSELSDRYADAVKLYTGFAENL